MAETRVVITAEAEQAIREFGRLRAEASQSLQQIGNGSGQLNQVSMSARQTAAALRQVPAQFTDIVVSLQAGQNPLTVLLQQGGQLRDMFGSTGAAARALGGYALSLINPYTVLAAAAAVVAVAYYQGSKEADAYTRAIVMSGNAAGVSKDQLASMARSIRQGGDTQAAGAEALSALVATGKVGRENLQAFATTAIRAEKMLGTAIGDTVKEFQELGKSPVEASLKLNERYNHLTDSVYQQIRALEKKGDIDGAAEIAQKAYAAAMDERLVSLKANLGTLESAWAAVRGWAVRAWDGMLNIGREDTLDQKIEQVKQKIKKVQLEQMTFVGSSKENRAESDVRKAALQQELEGLQKKQQSEKEANEEKAKSVALEQAKIKWSQDGEKYLTRQEQLESALAKARVEGTAAGKSEQEINERVAQVAKSYNDIANDAINAQIENVKRRGNVEDIVTRRSMALLASKHSVGLTNERDYIEQVTKLDLASFDRARARTQEELALTGKKQNSEKDQAALRGQLAEIDAQRLSRKLQGENQLNELEVTSSRKAAENTANVIDKQADAARQLAEQVVAQRDANAQIGLTKEGITQLTAARLMEKAVLADQNAQIAEGVDFSGQLAEKYRQQAQELRDLAAAQIEGGAKTAVADKFSAKDLEDFLDPAKAKSFGDALKDAFGGAGDAMVKLRTSLEDYGVAQTTIERARAAAAVAYAGDSTKLASATSTINKKEAQARIGAYGDMASAAKGFFSENSKGYKLLETTEKAFRAYEMAMALESMAKKIFFKEGEVAANIALNAAKLTGEAATSAASTGLAATEASAWGVTAVVKALASLPFPFNLAAGAVTLAAVLAIGAKVMGGVGGGGVDVAKQRQETQGTGTVLGNESAKSESIGRSIDNLEKYASIELSHTRDMLSALVKIRDTIGVVASMATQTAGLRATALDEKKYGVGSSSGVLGIGGSSTSIQDSGIKLNGSQTIGSAIGSGVDATGYADILKKSSGLWGIGASSKTRREVIELDDDLKKQFGLLVASLRDGSVEAVKLLGLSTDGILEKINGMALGIDEISFKGLTGDEIQKELEAVFSKVGDDIAKLAVPELAKFQQVGEGYFETLTRVATNYATLDSIMEASGRSFGAVGLASVEARERFIKMAGGIDALISSSQSFDDNFLSEAERLVPVQKYVTEQLAAMGLQGVQTRDQFKNVVLGLDVTTEAGARQYTALLALSDAFAKTHAATVDLTMSQQDIADQALELQNQYNDATMSAIELRARERQGIAATNLALYDRINALKDEQAASDTLLKIVDTAMTALTKSVNAQKTALAAANTLAMTALQTQIDAATNAVSKLTSLSSTLRSALDSLQPRGEDLSSRQSAQAEIASALAIARAGGPLPSADALKSALSAVTKDASDQFSSYVEYQRDLYRTVSDISGLASVTDSQLSVEQKTLDTLNEQKRIAQMAYEEEVKRLDAILDKAQASLDVLNGIATGVTSIPEALAALGDAITAAMANSIAGAGAAASSAYEKFLGRSARADEVDYWKEQSQKGVDVTGAIKGSDEARIQELYQTLLGRTGETAGVAAWQASLKAGNSWDQIKQAFMSSDEYLKLHVPGFATGGDHAGGARVVGEDGAEIEVTGPSRIFNASQTAAMLRGGSDQSDLIAELLAEQRAQRAENAVLRTMLEDHLYSIAKSNKNIEDHLDGMLNADMPVTVKFVNEEAA